MTLDDAINLYESNAEYERTHGSLQGCLNFRQLAEWLRDYKRLKEQQSCEDELDFIQPHKKIGVSLSPQPKTGRWIYDKNIENWRCSECGETPQTKGYCGTADFMAEHFKFCNHCGVKMGGGRR